MYEIIGSPKCGTSSLGEHLRKLGHDVIESEQFFLDTNYAENYSYERTPIIITRNVDDRNESDKLFFGGNDEESSYYSQYEAGIEMFYNPLIVSLEYMSKVKDFPHHNRNPNK